MTISTNRKAILIATGIIGFALSSTACGSDGQAEASDSADSGPACESLDAYKTAVDASVHPSEEWDGPTEGPPASGDKVIAVVAGTLQNGGVIGVVDGIKQAASALGWTVQVFDGQNSQSGENAAFGQAMAIQPDGIAVVGFPYNFVISEVGKAKEEGVPVVGWHASGGPGPTSDGLVFTNVSSDPNEIGKLAGQYAVVAQDGAAHVVIMTDTNIPITLAKGDAIKSAVTACSSSSVLDTLSFPFASITTQSPQLATASLQRFGSKMTDIFSINDLSFDASVPALQSAGISPTGNPHLISAGDGSASAFQRIRNGSFQTGTVAEPLHMHGWQVMDEFNRAFAGVDPSGYVTAPHLVIKENVDLYDGKDNLYDPPNHYTDAYIKIWGV